MVNPPISLIGSSDGPKNTAINSARDKPHEQAGACRLTAGDSICGLAVNGSKRWAFRFMLNGTQHEMGFGGLNKVSLSDARKKASDARLLLSEGRSPLIHKQELETQRNAAEKLSAARSMTFDKCAEVYVSAQEVGWKNEKHRQQWRNTDLC